LDINTLVLKQPFYGITSQNQADVTAHSLPVIRHRAAAGQPQQDNHKHSVPGSTIHA